MGAPSQRALLLSHSVAEFERRVNILLDYAETDPQASLAELEAEARRLSWDCFAPVLEGVLRWRSQELAGFPQCGCGRELRYKGQQQRSPETLVGRISWQRGYYYCESCRRGRYPLDKALGIGPGQFSDGVQSGRCRLGAALPFGLAAESFTALTGVSVSPWEAERLTEGRGAALEAHQEREQEAARRGQQEVNGAAVPPASGVGAVALDAAKVRFDDGWHEVKAGVVFWAEPQRAEWGLAGGKARHQSYAAEAGPMEPAGERLYREALRRGIDPSEDLVVCLGDGAPANWSQFGLHFPNRVEALDWYHATEHLWAAARDRLGEDSAQVETWVAARKDELWEGDVAAVLAALRAGPATSEIHYFETHRHRMRYREFRARGYPIGSGTLESACKRVIGARLKQAGMRWSRAGAQAVLSLRTQLLSGRWDAVWPLTRPQLAPA